ncbi:MULTISPECIES: hypothetical protein [unclassified Microbacterium]|nr:MULTISPECIES: hypothetical protein [unclassified Microbacterium]MCR2801861.1 hypothetical protein [Microbacterium sp. zg.Y818]MCR2825410.1 hypothetical protein [Microbacterium sp. zg.Y909]WIM22879.1 hypothetical protein QNO21_02250 [Microbacterium sp. zg-Y818]
MDTDNSHPSQAEGDDPDRPSEQSGTDDAMGHPSQAEGDDIDAETTDSE